MYGVKKQFSKVFIPCQNNVKMLAPNNKEKIQIVKNTIETKNNRIRFGGLKSSATLQVAARSSPPKKKF